MRMSKLLSRNAIEIADKEKMMRAMEMIDAFRPYEPKLHTLTHTTEI